MGDLGHIAGRGHLEINAHPVPSHLPWAAALSAMLPSLLISVFAMRLGPGPPLRSPPGLPLPSGRSASTPPYSPLGGRQSGIHR